MNQRMPFEPGTLLLANYTAKVKDTGEVIETTVEEEAKKLGVHDPARKYEPRLISIGNGWVIQGLEEAISNAEIGSKAEVEIPPEKAFGPRDPSKVRMIPLRKFGDRAADLTIGSEVEIDNRLGVLRFIGSGRAQVDFNHRFAGKNLIYQLELVKKLETDEEKVIALIRRRLIVPPEKLSWAREGDTISIRLPEETYLVEGLPIIKRAIATDIFRHIRSLQKIEFTESYENPSPEEKKPEETPDQPKPEEAGVGEESTKK